MVRQEHLDKHQGLNMLDVTHIQEEELISVQNQHQFMDLFTNMICIGHTLEVTSVGYHKQLLKD